MNTTTLQQSMIDVNPQIVIESLLRQQIKLVKMSDLLNEVTKPIRLISPINGEIYIPLAFLPHIVYYKSLVKICRLNMKFTDKRCSVTGKRMLQTFSTDKFPSETLYVSLSWLKDLLHKRSHLFKVKNANFNCRKTIAEFHLQKISR